MCGRASFDFVIFILGKMGNYVRERERESGAFGLDQFGYVLMLAHVQTVAFLFGRLIYYEHFFS